MAQAVAVDIGRTGQAFGGGRSEAGFAFKEYLQLGQISRPVPRAIGGRENPGIRQWRIVSPVAPRWKGAVFLEPAVPGRDDGVGYSGLRFIGTKRCSARAVSIAICE